MKKARKILWVKFGWSDYYRGGPVDGNFAWLNEQRGKTNATRGNEAFNFMPAADGTYYCYVPPQGPGYSPSHESRNGWTVVCLAKKPGHKGIHVVGWYENATLLGETLSPHPVAREAGGQDWYYSITSKSAYFVPPEARTDPFSDPSVRQGKYSLLSGPGIEVSENKARLLGLLESRLAALKSLAIHNPNPSNAPDPETDAVDPLSGFGTAEHRKQVEEEAEQAVVLYYKAKGFRGKRVAELNLGYDYIFSKGSKEHHVEVKGTSSSIARFFLTRNEHTNRQQNSRWRLAMVTNALSEPKVELFDSATLKAAFDLEPFVYIGTKIVEPKDS